MVPLAVAKFAPRVDGSPAPSRSPSPSTEADDEANILAKDEAMANILADAEFESDGSLGYITMDLEDDRQHGYATPIPES